MKNGVSVSARPRLEWRPQARLDLLEIVSHIAEDNPDAAQALKDEIETRVASLPDHPRLYRLSARVEGLRELVVRRNFIVFYRESLGHIDIINVIHARRQWPPAPGPA